MNLTFWNGLGYSGNLLPEELFHKTYVDSGNAWTTITTGVGFERHRILSFLHGPYEGHSLGGPIKTLANQSWIPRLGRRALISYALGAVATDGGKGTNPQSSDVPVQRVWEYLDTNALVFGLPVTYPTWSTNGVMVAGIPAPKPSEATHPLVSPQDLQSTVYDGEFGGYYVDTPSPVDDPSVTEKEYCEAHLEKVDAIAEKYVELADACDDREFGIGFGFLMFRAIDDVLHTTTDQALIDRVYRAVDDATTRVVEALDPEAVLVLSDHGMRPTSRPDVDLRMDHDTTQGIWGGTEPFGLDRHVDVTPAILEHFDVSTDFPVLKDNYDLETNRVDESAVQERLEDLGYA
jgi:hypothetical protein